MHSPLHKYASVSRLVLMLLLTLLVQKSWSQCNNTSAFGSATAPTNNTPVPIATCAFGGEYSTISSAVAGNTYLFTASGGTGNFLTVRQGTSGGTVLGFGFSPLSVTCTVSGPLYLHYNTNAACGTDASCHSSTIQCTSCAPPAASACNNTSSFGSATIDPTGAIVTIATCSFAGEYSTISGAVAGQSLRFTSSVSSDNITVRSGSPSGPVLGFGFTPFTLANTFTGTIYVHWNTPGCGSESNCRTTTVQCLSCATYNPCASIPTVACGGSVSPSSTGTGAWSTVSNSCGFSTPGQERIYSFTPIATGNHTLVTTAATGGYADYFYKVASGGCTSTGWTCIGDANAAESNTFGPLTAGTTYYILFDPEVTTTVSHTLRVDCPSSAPPCVSAPTSPANGATVCPNTAVTLSWPAAATATSYDVYFGTTATPVFVGNTTSTSYSVGTQTTGTRYWQIRPVSAGGTAAGCTIWNFNMSDVTLPNITCPANVTVNAATNLCSAVVTYGAVTGTDNCSAPTLVLVSGQASGTSFPVGLTTNVWRATDGSGNTRTCSFTVRVNDTQLPNITCPANIVRNNDANVCGANVTYTTPTASDNCSLAAGSPFRVSGQASGTVFPVGITTNVYRANDASGNSRTCSFTVTVNDTQKPTITCPDNILKGNDFGDCGAKITYLGTPVIKDNCAFGALTNNAPAQFPLGTTTLTWVINDSHGNSASCSQTVTIEDREFPVVTCPSNINVKTDLGDCVATIGYTANASDNCSGTVITYSTEPLSTFEVGYSNVEVTATDNAGNSVSCAFQISVSTRLEVCNGVDDDCDGLVDESEDWAKIAKQFGSDSDDLDHYGVSVGIDGNYAVVGSNKRNSSGQSLGAAYVLFRDKNGPNAWGQILKLDAPGLLPGDNFGASVAISNGIIAVGAPQDDDVIGDEGSIYIFAQSSSNPAQWNFVKKVTVLDTDSGDNLGVSVALDGDHLIAGANLDDDSAPNAGAAYVFYRNKGGNDNWGEVAKLKATTGSDNDNMGVSVDIQGDYAIVGANGVDGFLSDVGAAYVFGRNQFGPDAWGQVAKLEAAVGGQGDNFGASVAISGSWALVGADHYDRSGADAGAAFVFYKNQNGISNSWGQRNILLNVNGKAGDHFGSSVAMDGEYAVIGASGDDDLAITDAGSGFVYLRQDNGWVMVNQLKDGSSQNGDQLGGSAAISGRTALLGEAFDDASGNIDQGSVLVYGGLCNQNRPGERDVISNTSDASLRCFPVPFSSVLSIEVSGMEAPDAQVVVVNTLGQTVANLYNGAMQGDMTFQWRPLQAASGVYFLRVIAGEKILTQTVVLER